MPARFVPDPVFAESEGLSASSIFIGEKALSHQPNSGQVSYIAGFARTRGKPPSRSGEPGYEPNRTLSPGTCIKSHRTELRSHWRIRTRSASEDRRPVLPRWRFGLVLAGSSKGR